MHRCGKWRRQRGRKTFSNFSVGEVVGVVGTVVTGVEHSTQAYSLPLYTHVCTHIIIRITHTSFYECMYVH